MISPRYGGNADFFGHADYYQARAQGFNPMQILNHLRSNMNQLRMNNLPGRSDPRTGMRSVFDMAMDDARMYERSVAPQQKKPEPPPPPKATTTSASAVGGSAKGVKIKRSNMQNTSGTKSLNRKNRNRSMQISNLNLA